MNPMKFSVAERRLMKNAQGSLLWHTSVARVAPNTMPTWKLNLAFVEKWALFKLAIINPPAKKGIIRLYCKVAISHHGPGVV